MPKPTIIIDFPQPKPIDWFTNCKKFEGLWKELREKMRRESGADFVDVDGVPKWDQIALNPDHLCRVGDRRRLETWDRELIAHVCITDIEYLAPKFAAAVTGSNWQTVDNICFEIIGNDGGLWSIEEIRLLLKFVVRPHWFCGIISSSLPEVDKTSTLILLLQLCEDAAVRECRMKHLNDFINPSKLYIDQAELGKLGRLAASANYPSTMAAIAHYMPDRLPKMEKEDFCWATTSSSCNETSEFDNRALKNDLLGMSREICEDCSADSE